MTPFRPNPLAPKRPLPAQSAFRPGPARALPPALGQAALADPARVPPAYTEGLAGTPSRPPNAWIQTGD